MLNEDSMEFMSREDWEIVVSVREREREEG